MTRKITVELTRTQIDVLVKAAQHALNELEPAEHGEHSWTPERIHALERAQVVLNKLLLRSAS